MQADDTMLYARDMAALDPAALKAVAALSVLGQQEDLGGTFRDSVSEWQNGPPDDLLGLSFWLGDAPCGLVFLKGPPTSPGWVPPDGVSLHRLKIDAGYQGRGLGRLAFSLAVQRVRARWPEVCRLVLAVDAGNEPALAVCRG